MDARKMMDRDAVKLLEARDLQKYGNPDGPTFEQLVDKGLGDGKTLRQVYEDIIGSSTRTNQAYNRKAGL